MVYVSWGKPGAQSEKDTFINKIEAKNFFSHNLVTHRFRKGEEMATLRKRNNLWQIQIRRVGHKLITKTFPLKSTAEKWARSMEKKLDDGNYSDYSEASKLLLSDLLHRYIRENKHKRKKGADMELIRQKYILKDPIAEVNCLRLSTKHLAEFKSRRLMTVVNNTFNKDLSFISNVIETAIHDWEIYFPSNPCRNFKTERPTNARKRVLTEQEEQRLIASAALSKFVYLKPMIIFSLETAVRRGELFKIKKKDIDFSNCVLTLHDTKNSDTRTIPLSEKAIMILRSLPIQLDGKMFPHNVSQLRFYWHQALGKADIEEMRWHDLRRTCCVRLFKRGFGIPEVQSITGHRDPKVLLEHYNAIDPIELARRLG